MTSQPLDERAAELEMPAMPSTSELFALARRNIDAAIRTLDNFGWFWEDVQELVEDKTRELLDTRYFEDEADADREAWDWLYRQRPDLDREETRLQRFAWNLARIAPNPVPLRAAARDHHHWAWSDLALGLRRRRLERRAVDSHPELDARAVDRRAHARRLRPQGRQRGAGRPGARRVGSRSGSSPLDDDLSDSDDEHDEVGRRRRERSA